MRHRLLGCGLGFPWWIVIGGGLVAGVGAWFWRAGYRQPESSASTNGRLTAEITAASTQA